MCSNKGLNEAKHGTQCERVRRIIDERGKFVKISLGRNGYVIEFMQRFDLSTSPSKKVYLLISYLKTSFMKWVD